MTEPMLTEAAAKVATIRRSVPRTLDPRDPIANARAFVAEAYALSKVRTLHR